MTSAIYVVVNAVLETRYEKRTGIPRVEYEVARYLVARGAKAVAWERNRFVPIDFERMFETPAETGSLDVDGACDAPTAHSSMPRLRLALARALGPLARRSPPWANLSRIVHGLVAAEWPRLTTQQRRAVLERLGLSRDRQRLVRFLQVLGGRRGGPRRPVFFYPRARLSSGATLLLLSTWWDDWPFDVTARLKASHDLRFVCMIHDLLPIRHREFFHAPSQCDRARRHVDLVLRLADGICTTSRYVANDLAAYAAETGVTIRPITPVALCSDLRRSAPAAQSSELSRVGLQPNGFVLYVSSVNPRKNHQWAYHLWRRAVQQIGDAVPTLVFAGQGVDGGSLRLMSQDGLMWDRKLKTFESPTDAELAWLYENCAFTIFPSLAEGWGLPITESLSFGKYCLAADNTSLAEAGQGLVFHADPLDGAAWLAEIRRLVCEPGYLAAATARVAAEFRSRSWDDVSAEVLALVERTRAAAPINSVRSTANGA
ncbi:MAG: glycosyltransferase [Alphaproteobacteria bacterium]|nr:glycosyltransferase [Alphaproteobacteria bacterium]MCW5738673.1 glycosyltransferase [Alphaproteobacteria bacterium]